MKTFFLKKRKHSLRNIRCIIKYRCERMNSASSGSLFQFPRLYGYSGHTQVYICILLNVYDDRLLFPIHIPIDIVLFKKKERGILCVPFCIHILYHHRGLTAKIEIERANWKGGTGINPPPLFDSILFSGRSGTTLFESSLHPSHFYTHTEEHTHTDTHTHSSIHLYR